MTVFHHGENGRSRRLVALFLPDKDIDIFSYLSMISGKPQMWIKMSFYSSNSAVNDVSRNCQDAVKALFMAFAMHCSVFLAQRVSFSHLHAYWDLWRVLELAPMLNLCKSWRPTTSQWCGNAVPDLPTYLGLWIGGVCVDGGRHSSGQNSGRPQSASDAARWRPLY